MLARRGSRLQTDGELRYPPAERLGQAALILRQFLLHSGHVRCAVGVPPLRVSVSAVR